MLQSSLESTISVAGSLTQPNDTMPAKPRRLLIEKSTRPAQPNDTRSARIEVATPDSSPNAVQFSLPGWRRATCTKLRSRRVAPQATRSCQVDGASVEAATGHHSVCQGEGLNLILNSRQDGDDVICESPSDEAGVESKTAIKKGREKSTGRIGTHT